MNLRWPDASLFFVPGFFLYALLFPILILSIVKTGHTSQHADILFLHWHSQRDGVMDESNDRCCTCACRASEEVCKIITEIIIFTEFLYFIWRLVGVLIDGDFFFIYITSGIDFEFLGSFLYPFFCFKSLLSLLSSSNSSTPSFDISGLWACRRSLTVLNVA